MSKSDKRAKFEMKFTKPESDRFFDAIAWSLDPRPLTAPTIATIFRNGEFMLLQELGIPLKNVLHGEQRYKFISDLKPDIKYRGETFIANHYEKSGSGGTSMDFYIFQTNLYEPNASTPSVECHSTIIARIKAP